MVTVVGVLVKGRDQRMASGASSVASVRPRVSLCERNVDVVDSAACRPPCCLHVGYRARPWKKGRKALSRWRIACCSGTLDTSFSHAVSGGCVSTACAPRAHRVSTA